MSDEMPLWVRRLTDQAKIVVFCLVFVGLLIAPVFQLAVRKRE